MTSPQLVAFDLDGTLAASKQPLEKAMGVLIAKLLDTRPVAVLSGAGFSQFTTQFLTHLPAETNLSKLYLFPDNAAQCFTYANSAWHAAYDLAFSPEEKTRALEALHTALGAAGMAEAPARTWGERIEDRGAEIAFSPLGQQAPLAEKQAWHDAHDALRQQLREDLAAQLPDFAVAAGGLTTIDITRKGITKAYGLEQLARLTNIPIGQMLYVGDALGPGGNDAVVLATGVPTQAVTGPEQTALCIQKLL